MKLNYNASLACFKQVEAIDSFQCKAETVKRIEKHFLSKIKNNFDFFESVKSLNLFEVDYGFESRLCPIDCWDDNEEKNLLLVLCKKFFFNYKIKYKIKKNKINIIKNKNKKNVIKNKN